MDASNLYEIPYHDKFRIDSQSTTYILDDSGNIVKTIPLAEMKFVYKNKIYYTMEMSDLVFFGVKWKSEFKEFKRVNDTDIDVNGVIFRKIPNFLDGYYISNIGAVYSMYRNCLRKREVDEDGYIRISFSHPGMTHMAIHRLVYSTWVGPIPEGYAIDHIDNRKWNNDYRNLQAVTSKENSRMAAEDNLYKTTFHWTKDRVIAVCDMMKDNISVQDIAKSFGITPEQRVLYKNFRNQLWNFRMHQRSWMDITSEYDFSKYDGFMRPDSKFRDSEILEMRQMYKDGIPIKEIAKKFDVKMNHYFSRLVRGLKRKNIKLQSE